VYIQCNHEDVVYTAFEKKSTFGVDSRFTNENKYRYRYTQNTELGYNPENPLDMAYLELLTLTLKGSIIRDGVGSLSFPEDRAILTINKRG
jgi:hypothetical protein